MQPFCTVEEAQAWYKEYYLNQTEQTKPFVSPLYYRGSDNKFHYFISRYMNDWVFIKIKIGDLVITDVRPKLTLSGGSYSGRIGYYQVDPLDSFRKVEVES